MLQIPSSLLPNSPKRKPKKEKRKFKKIQEKAKHFECRVAQ
jgi:hypothetical protein